VSIYDFHWSPSEKKIACTAYNLVYAREMKEIRKEVLQRIQNMGRDEDVWSLKDFLHSHRREMNYRYNYRYSILILTFFKLINRGYLSLEDLPGLSQEKLDALKRAL
jgi:hypothetical protein